MSAERARAGRRGIRFAAWATAVALGALLYLVLWPVPIRPEAWRPPGPPYAGAEGPAPEPLAGLRRIPLGDARGPEDVAFDARGRLYTGVEDGRILRLRPDGSGIETFARTGGRPLGLDFAADGELMVADARRGLLGVSAAGVVRRLSAVGGGVRVSAANDVEVAPDGTVYFTSPTGPRFDPGRTRNIVEHRPLGRLWAYEPGARTTRLVRDSLHFANGLLVTPDGQFVLVAETAAYRVARVPIGAGPLGDGGARAAAFVENLPGFPDGLDLDSEGRIWVALVAPRSRFLDALMPHPFLRKALWRIPSGLRPAPAKGARLLAFDLQGRLLLQLRDDTGAFTAVTHAVEREGRLHLGSLEENALAWIPVP